MDRAEYDKLDRAEDRMWWFAALHDNLMLMYRALARPSAGGSERLLDAGCGTGGLLSRLAADGLARSAIGLDADSGACARAAAKSHRPICAGSVNALPFANAAFTGIFSADVLCHRGVDEQAALAQFHRCLEDGGLLILNLPAYGWMMSRHDKAVANVRRYSRRGAERLLRSAGFRLVFVTYWNMLLFPLMVISRKLFPADEGSDVRTYAAPVEALCRSATRLERLVLRRGIRLPFGGSLIAVAAKEAPEHA